VKIKISSLDISSLFNIMYQYYSYLCSIYNKLYDVMKFKMHE